MKKEIRITDPHRKVLAAVKEFAKAKEIKSIPKAANLLFLELIERNEK